MNLFAGELIMTYEFVATKCICCGYTNLAKSPAILMPFVASRVFDHEPLKITEEWGLRDLQEGYAYTLCNSLQCQRCGVLFLDYRFTDKQMQKLYFEYRGEAYNQERINYEPGYSIVSARLEQRADYLVEVEKWLSQYIPDSPLVLDWGGGTGLNSLFYKHSKGLHIYDISGVELLRGQKVTKEQITEYDYDLISCCQVLEHIPYPSDVLHEILSGLKVGSFLYLEVPYESLIRDNLGNFNLSSLKKHWHEHINFFTESSLRALLLSYGLTVVDVACFSTSSVLEGRRVIGVLSSL